MASQPCAHLPLVEKWTKKNKPFRLIIDGAHSVGLIPIELAGKPDFYIFSGHKWMMGPAALGILVLRNHIFKDEGLSEDVLTGLKHQVFESLAFIGSDPPGETAATVAIDPFVGMSEALNVLMSEEANIVQRLRDVKEIFRQSCEKSDHIQIIAYDKLPTAPGIVTIQKKGVVLDLGGLKNVERRLEVEDRIVVKTVSNPYPEVPHAIRICLPFYLEKRDIIRITSKIDAALGKQG